MLGPIGAHVMSVLKVMTPSEIDRYARASERRKTSAVAAGAEDFDLEHSQTGSRHAHSGSFKKMTEAEIIPLRPENEGKREEPPPKRPSQEAEGKTGEADKELESVGIFSGQKIQDMKNQAQEIARAAEDSSSVFLLKQRAKLKETNSRMVGNAALKTYAETAHADMTQVEVDLENPDEETCQGSKGILINKKHF